MNSIKKLRQVFDLVFRTKASITKEECDIVLGAAELLLGYDDEPSTYSGEEFYPADAITVSAVTEPFYKTGETTPKVKAGHTTITVLVYCFGTGFHLVDWYNKTIIVDADVAERAKTLTYAHRYNNKLDKWEPSFTLSQESRKETGTYSIGYALYGDKFYGARRKVRPGNDYTRENYTIF